MLGHTNPSGQSLSFLCAHKVQTLEQNSLDVAWYPDKKMTFYFKSLKASINIRLLTEDSSV